MNLNELSAEIHEIAQSKGWWDEPRSTDDIIALCHSELSEALEAYRGGHAVDEVWWAYKGNQDTTIQRVPKSPGPNWKPEGVPIELADCVIRVVDYAHHLGADLNIRLMPERAETLSELICECHQDLSQARFWGAGESGDQRLHLASVVRRIQHYLGDIGHDLETLIRVKCAYNRTRPHRHGGKVI